MIEHQVVREHTALVSQTVLNSYPYADIPGMSWEMGQLVVHFAGCWVRHECNGRWKEFMALRTPVSALTESN